MPKRAIQRSSPEADATLLITFSAGLGLEANLAGQSTRQDGQAINQLALLR